MTVTQIMIVTGGSRGIGAATARLAAQRGYDLCVNYLGHAECAEAVVREAEAAGRRAIAVQADVSKEDQVERLFETVDRDLGPLTALVNNAGVTGRSSRLDAVEAETLERVLDINVLGVMLCARAAVKRMSTKHGGQGGAIANVSSAAASLGGPGEYVWYAASKGAVDSLTVGLAKEVAGEGIRVNGVAPGLIETEIHAAGGNPQRLEALAPSVPLGRAAGPEEVAEPILWLLSEAASYTTGAILRVGGGR
jgi:NAD(P)-dependent dehydrogenase (short-subunit alcohol dehydrogenase family)